jgi:hypothetical protein
MHRDTANVSFWGGIPVLLRTPCQKHDNSAITERQYLAFSGIIPPGPISNPKMPKYGVPGTTSPPFSRGILEIKFGIRDAKCAVRWNADFGIPRCPIWHSSECRQMTNPASAFFLKKRRYLASQMPHLGRFS